MKKIFVILCVGSLMIGMLGCGKADNRNESQNNSENQSSEESQNSSDAQGSSGSAGDSEDGYDYSDGWTSEMDAVREAVVEALGEDYWPDMALQPDMLESLFGVTADMYDDYLAEMPMISNNVDTLVIIKAKEGQADAVEAALTAYRENLVSDTLQYPMNVGKVQASRVEKIGNYVCFVQLGADTMETLDQGDEAVIAQCQETNELVIEIISQKVQ